MKVTISQLSKEEQVYVVENLFERKSYIAVQAVVQQQFNQAPPCKKTIQQNITKYCLHGTNLNKNKENSGRQKTGRFEENIELVRKIFENNPNFEIILRGAE